MNTAKIAAAVLEMSQALAKIATALSEVEPDAVPPRTAPTVAVPPQTAPAVAAPPPAGSDAFTAFADQIKSILQTVPPGALNVQLGQMIERYAPGAGAPGQGGIRKIPETQYPNFLAEVDAAAKALGGGAR